MINVTQILTNTEYVNHSQAQDVINIKLLKDSFVNNIFSKNNIPNYSLIMKNNMIKQEKFFDMKKIFTPEFMQLIKNTHTQQSKLLQLLQTTGVIALYNTWYYYFIDAMVLSKLNNSMIILFLVGRLNCLYYYYWKQHPFLQKYSKNNIVRITGLIFMLNNIFISRIYYFFNIFIPNQNAISLSRLAIRQDVERLLYFRYLYIRR